MTPGQMYAAGLTLRQVAERWSAEHFPVSHETVRMWVIAEGIPMRAPSPTVRLRRKQAA